jgi:hypothetical protein
VHARPADQPNRATSGAIGLGVRDGIRNWLITAAPMLAPFEAADERRNPARKFDLRQRFRWTWASETPPRARGHLRGDVCVDAG